jgi:hypothetical protein
MVVVGDDRRRLQTRGYGCDYPLKVCCCITADSNPTLVEGIGKSDRACVSCELLCDSKNL